MKKYCIFVFTLFQLNLFLCPLPAKELEWTNKAGRTIKAEFVSANNESLTLSVKGRTAVVKLSDLNTKSQALARKLNRQAEAKTNAAPTPSTTQLTPANLRDPKFKEVLLKKACDKKELHRRSRDGLLIDIDSGTPYSGWVKESRGGGLALGQYKSGKPEGYLFMWDSKGQIRGWSQNIDGKKEGLWIVWREDGMKKEEINYKNGEPHGRVTSWHTNGHKMSEVFYEEGKMVGVRTEWHRNGKKKEEMKLGRNESFVRTEWDEHGKETSRVKVEGANSGTPRKSIWDGKQFVRDLSGEINHIVNLPVDAGNQSLTQSTGNLAKINIQKSGAYVILGKQVTAKQIEIWMTGELKKKPDLKVLIRVDQEAKYLYLANVLSICRSVGVPTANIAHKTEK